MWCYVYAWYFETPNSTTIQLNNKSCVELENVFAHPPHHTNSMSAVSQLLLTRFWWNFKRKFLFLGASITDPCSVTVPYLKTKIMARSIKNHHHNYKLMDFETVEINLAFYLWIMWSMFTYFQRYYNTMTIKEDVPDLEVEILNVGLLLFLILQLSSIYHDLKYFSVSAWSLVFTDLLIVYRRLRPPPPHLPSVLPQSTWVWPTRLFGTWAR